MVEKNEAIGLNWLKSFNSRDLNTLIELYHKDATHFSPKLKARQPETKGLIQGHSALRAWWQDAFDRLPSLYYRLSSVTANQERVILEYIRENNGEDDLLVAEKFEIRQGLIISSIVYHA